MLSGDDLAADHTATNYTADNANIDGHLSGIDTKLGTISGGGGYTYATASGATNAQAGYHYSCTTTMTLTLPTSGITAGEEIRVKNMGTGTITIARNGVLIDGVASDYTLDVRYSSVTLVYTGTNYEVV